MGVRYNRAPSATFLKLLSKKAFLAPLCQSWNVEGLDLDLQFREGDEAHLYCGQTRLLAARMVREGVRFKASPTYTGQSCAKGLFRTWGTAELGLSATLQSYFASVDVDGRWVKKEGTVQAAWMASGGPWVSLDREAVLGYENVKDADASTNFPAVNRARADIGALAHAGGWAKMPSVKKGNELDQLALDSTGALVLVELKWGGAADVYWAPLQLLRYIHQWHAALPTVQNAVDELAKAKAGLGLLTATTPLCSGKLRPVLAWGQKQPSAEQLRRLDEVLDIVQGYLPQGVGKIEVWHLGNGPVLRP